MNSIIELETITNLENDYKYYHLIYNSDGRKVHGYIGEPASADNSTPIIIFNRGGTMEHGTFTDITFRTSFLIKRMIDWGYIVITTQYSGNGGSEGKDEFGGMDLDDIINLYPVLKNYTNGDISKIGMVGGSRGGTMTYLALTKVNWIKAAVIEAGLTDHKRNLELRPDMVERTNKMFDTTSQSIIMKRSPINSVKSISRNAAILIMHGTDDDKVSPLDSIELALNLQKNNFLNYKLIMFPKGDHQLSNHREEECAQLRKWLDASLKI